MTADTSPVAIAGAGMAGLTTALLLARQGLPVELFERAPALSEVGAGIQLSPNAGRILSALGLDAALDARAIRPDFVAMRSGRDGHEIARVPLGETALARYRAPYRVIHRADLQAVLLEAAEASPAIALHLGAAIEAPVQDDDGVTITSAGRERRFGVLIGADGVWSATRPAVNATAASPTGQTAWRAVLPADTNTRHVDLWLARDAHIVRYPVAGGQMTNIVVITADRSTELADHEQETALPTAPLARLAPELRALLARPSGWTRWPLCAVKPDGAWTNQRIALVGDAAHAMLPFLAQGGAMAIEDAAELSAAIARDGVSPEALAAYARRRKSRVSTIWHEAARLAGIYHLGRPASIARDLALAALGPERLIARMDSIYGWRPSALPT